MTTLVLSPTLAPSSAKFVLIVAVGTAGDVNPFLAIGRSLTESGVPVVVLTSRDHCARARAIGLKAIAVAAPSLSQRQAFLARNFETVILPSYRAVFETVREFKRRRAVALVVAHDLALGALFACERLGLACVKVTLAPCGLPRSDEIAAHHGAPGGATGKVRDAAWERRLVNRLRKNLRLPPLARLTDLHDHFARQWIGLFPDWFLDASDRSCGVDVVGFPHSGSSPQPLDAALAALNGPIVFTLGSAGQNCGPAVEAAAALCEALDAPGVFLGGDIASAGRLVHRPSADLDALFARARLVVHHGGLGTTAQAIRAGAPQVVSPAFFDQPDNARRLEALGLGRIVPRCDLTPERLIAAARASLSSADRRYESARQSFARRTAAQDGARIAAGLTADLWNRIRC